MTPEIKEDIQSQLSDLLEHYSLQDIIATLAEVCDTKADEVSINQQHRVADVWRKNSITIYNCLMRLQELPKHNRRSLR